MVVGSPDEKADLEYSVYNHNHWRWLSMLTAERNRDIARYVGSSPRAPAKKNQEGRWVFCEGRTIDEVLDAARAGCNLARRSAPLRIEE